MGRKLIIAGNWKMNHTASETKRNLTAFISSVSAVKDIELVVCPTFTSLSAAADVARNTNVSIGAQNVHWERKGAYTGEISAEMLKEIPVDFVIVGHSERRQYFGETDESVNGRLRAAIDAGLKPIVCVGETLEQRNSGQTESIVSKQISTAFGNLSAGEMESVTIAYEPIWAIGTGMTATPDQAQEVHKFIRGLVKEKFSTEISEQIRIQYGGSVKTNNIGELVSKPDIDGALVGGASLIAGEFGLLIRSAAS